MRNTLLPAWLLLGMLLAACSDIETRPAETGTFAAGHYRYYMWRSEPPQNMGSSQDPAYLIDPVVRQQVDKNLAEKGYVLDPARAQFSVDYIYAPGLRMGELSNEASNITPYPSVTPNRQVNQAVVDNAYALAGVKETANLALQFNDVTTKREVWQVVITKIVDNVNKIDMKVMKDSLREGIRKALEPLPQAPG